MPSFKQSHKSQVSHGRLRTLHRCRSLCSIDAGQEPVPRGDTRRRRDVERRSCSTSVQDADSTRKSTSIADEQGRIFSADNCSILFDESRVFRAHDKVSEEDERLIEKRQKGYRASRADTHSPWGILWYFVARVSDDGINQSSFLMNDPEEGPVIIQKWSGWPLRKALNTSECRVLLSGLSR